MFIRVIEILIVILVVALIYINILYPIILVLLAKIFKYRIESKTAKTCDITVLVAAYNEEAYIKDSIDALYNSGYPIDKIKVIVGSDGSSDNTVGIVNKLAGKYPNLYCRDLPRGGKNSVINTLMKEIDTDLVFFLDADTRINKGVIETLLEFFEDENVGAALARLNIIDEEDDNNSGKEGESLYQKYETIIRSKESEVFSTVNAMGAFYAVRRELLKEIPNNLVCDDLFNVLTVNYFKKRVIFVPSAIVNEIRKKSLGEEMKRRVRLAAGGLSTIVARKELLGSGYGWSRFFLISHKVSRYFMPLILILIMLFTPVLGYYNSVLFLPSLFGQIALYILALIGKITERTSLNLSILNIPLFFVSMCIGYTLGWIRFIKGGQSAIWERFDTLNK